MGVLDYCLGWPQQWHLVADSLSHNETSPERNVIDLPPVHLFAFFAWMLLPKKGKEPCQMQTVKLGPEYYLLWFLCH